MCTVFHKKEAAVLLPEICEISTNLQNSFAILLDSKFVVKLSIETPSNTNIRKLVTV